MSNVGEEVKRLRQAKGWTQEQLAVYAGSSQPTVNLLEAGKRNPSAATLEKLASALEVEVVDLFPKARPPKPSFTGSPRRSSTTMGATYGSASTYWTLPQNSGSGSQTKGSTTSRSWTSSF